MGLISERYGEEVDVVTGEPAAFRPDGSPAGTGITVYGAGWCGDSRRSLALLDRLGLAYAYVDIDAHPAANAWAAAQNGGPGARRVRIPVVVLGADGPVLIEPGDEALLAALGETGYLLPAVDRAGAAHAHGRGSIAAR